MGSLILICKFLGLYMQPQGCTRTYVITGSSGELAQLAFKN
jgi:hypothetical protein